MAEANHDAVRRVLPTLAISAMCILKKRRRFEIATFEMRL